MATTSIWLNVTTSFDWRGPVVGVVRTEVEILNKLNSFYQSKIRLCVFRNSGFVEISQDEYFSKTIKCQNVDTISPYVGMGNLEKLKAKVRSGDGIYHLTPKFARPLVVPFFKYIKRKVFRKGINHKAAIQKRIKSFSEVKEDGLNIFKGGDIFLSFGADWNYTISEKLFYIRRKGVKVITCCYDVIPIIMPQYCLSATADVFKEYFIEVAQGSDTIMCISKRSRDDLKQFLEEVGTRIPHFEIMRLGSNPEKSIHEERISEQVQATLSSDYILYVSTIERRKNHETLYKAYHRIIQKFGRSSLPKLVFVGMTGWGVQDTINDIQVDPITKGHIVLLGRVNERELDLLYKKCRFTVFPSMYEGWGLGVAESLQHGKFVLASNAGSLPEVGKDLIWYEDPWNVPGWADKLYELSQSKELLDKLTEVVKKEYTPFSWDDTCADVMKEINRFVKPI